MADYNIKGEMTLATGSFISSAKAASNSLNGLNGSSKTAGAGVNILGGIMKKVALGAIATFAVKLGRDSVKAAQEAGAAQFRLKQILLTTGGATEAQIAILDQQASALAKMTVVSKENITVVQSQLATFDLHSGAIAKLTPAILDYVTAEKGASAGAEEYKNMTNGLALALNGQFGALTRVGFVIDDATKKQISSGTEMERAAAIAKVLNSTYKDYAITVGDTAAGAQQKLANQAANLKQTFGEMLLPVIQKVQMFIGNNLMPAIQGLMDKFKDGSAISSFISFVGGLLGNLYDFGSAIASVVGPVLVNVLVPAFLAVGAAIVGVIKVLGVIGEFMKRNIRAFQIAFQVIAVAAAGYLAYRAAIIVTAAAQKAWYVITNLGTIATKGFTAAQRMLNATMAFNPIALAVGALAALIGLFVIAWNNSESFRKIMIQVGKAGVMGFGYIIKIVGVLLEGLVKVVTGPMRLLLKALDLLGVDAAGKALNGIEKMTSGIGDFFDKAGNKVQDFADKLDGLQNKKIKLPSFKLPTVPKGKTATGVPDLSGLDGGGPAAGIDEAAKELAKKLGDLKEKLDEVVVDYNDFINNDFAKGFVQGSETARDTMLKGLDELKKVFDAQKDIFEAKGDAAGLAKVKSEWDKINKYVRGRIAEAMAIAAELEKVEKELEKAYDRLKEAVAARAEGAKAFGEMIKTPFGQPSDIQKAMADGEATVDGIIGMYDKMRDALDKRFTEIGGTKKNELVNYLTDQTAELVKLAKRREAAAKALEAAQKSLDKVLEEQASFKTSIQESIKSFGTALADLSKSNSDNTIKVIKTASGLVITQMSQGTSGVDTIINKLKTSLTTIREFTANIQALLTQGYNKEYVRTLLEAGPEAAGATAALLAKSGSDTMTTVNDLYKNIDDASKVFGSSMSSTFYDNSVSMAKALVKGAKDEYDSIMASMKSIADGITAAFAPLADVGLKVGNDIIQDIIDSLEARRRELIDRANQIAAEVAAAMAAAAGAIGVTVSSQITPNPGGTTDPVVVPPVVDPVVPPVVDPVVPPVVAPVAPVTPVTPATKTATAAAKYVVKAGDTLSAIAKANNTTLKAVLAANPKFTDVAKYKDGNMIWSGTTVVIPPKTVAAAAPKGVAYNDAQNTARLTAQAQNNNFEKGAFNIVVPPNTKPEDLEPVLTRTLINAMGAR